MPKINRIDQVPSDKGNYIAGFVDGEGSFYFTARPRKDFPSGWKFSLAFNISQNEEMILNICKKYFGCGQIREAEAGKYILEINNKKNLENFIIPFFQRFSFLSTKKKYEFAVFQRFFKQLDLPICNENDLQIILKFRKELSKYRKDRSKNTDEQILQTYIYPSSPSLPLCDKDRAH